MESRFELGQEVVIKAVANKGLVVGLYQELNGAVNYSVRYFDDDSRSHTA